MYSIMRGLVQIQQKREPAHLINLRLKVWNWDNIGMRMWRWGQPSSTAFYQRWELREDEVTSPSPRLQSSFGGIRHRVQLSVKDMPSLHATGFWIFSPQVWRTLENILLSEEKSSWILEKCNKNSWKWKGRYLTNNMWEVSYSMGCSISWMHSAPLCCWPYHSNFPSRPYQCFLSGSCMYHWSLLKMPLHFHQFSTQY